MANFTKRHKLLCLNRQYSEYLYSSNDTIYFFDKPDNEFKVLYNFNSSPQDSWTINVINEAQKTDTITVTVDSVSTISVNEYDLKALYVTYSKNTENEIQTHSSVIIEKIGDIQYMFNWYQLFNVQCDANYTNGLRCYQDAEIGLFSTGIADACDNVYTWNGSNHTKSSINIELFPNPVRDFTEIKIAKCLDYSVEVFDINGKMLMVLNSIHSDTRLDLSNFENGIYMIRIIHQNKFIGFKKFLKE